MAGGPAMMLGGTQQPRWVRPAVVLLAMMACVMVFRQHAAPRPLAPAGAFEEIAYTLPTTEGGALAPKTAVEHPVADGSSRQATATTSRTRLYTAANTYRSEDVAGLAEPIETTIGYVEQRTGYRLVDPINIIFDRRPGGCGLDAAAFTDVRTLFVYVCPDIPYQRALNVLAHEVVHQLAHDRYGAAHLRADIILGEGVATWGAGDYWLGTYDSFHDFVAANYRANLLPLDADSRGASTATMNQLYYQWAAFVEWIRATHGDEAFDRLYVGGTGRQPGTAPYADVLGMSLRDAETAWRAWLDQPVP